VPRLSKQISRGMSDSSDSKSNGSGAQSSSSGLAISRPDRKFNKTLDKKIAKQLSGVMHTFRGMILGRSSSGVDSNTSPPGTSECSGSDKGGPPEAGPNGLLRSNSGGSSSKLAKSRSNSGLSANDEVNGSTAAAAAADPCPPSLLTSSVPKITESSSVEQDGSTQAVGIIFL